MSKQQELDKLATSIKDAEARLNVFKSNLDAIDKELNHLTTVETQLQENIKFLRKKHIIALALEYKKAKEELHKTRNRLAMIRIDRGNIGRAYKDVEDFLVKTKAQYAKLLKDSDNVVIQGSFGRQNGQGGNPEEN